MNTRELYENYYANRKLQKGVIKKDNFTYRNLIPFIDRYFKKNNILDIGCGVGTIDFYLASKGKKVIGVDISSSAVNLAKRNVKILNLRIKPKFQALNFMNYKVKEKFDCILVTEVLEHLSNYKLAVKRIFNLLKSNGILIASSPSKNAPLFKKGLLKGFDKEVGHLRRYSKGQFVDLFEKSGFEIIEVKLVEGVIKNTFFTNKYANTIVRFIRGPIADFVTFVDNLTVPFFGESSIILVAKKK